MKTAGKKIFLKLFSNFEKKIPADFYEFCAENAFWLDDYARFMAIKDKFSGASFDVWDSARPRFELYGTKGTLIMPEPHPNSGPNIFGGKIVWRKSEDFRWGVMPCPAGMEEKPFDEVTYDRPFSETGHDRNSRGIGLVDQVCALSEGRIPRAYGMMALHVLEIAEALGVAANEECWVYLDTACERPDPLPEFDPYQE